MKENTKPSTLNTKPSTLNTKPSTLNHITMNISFSGITQAVSDHDCKDGEMSMLLNLIPEHDALAPVTIDNGDDDDEEAERHRWSERCGMNVNAVVRCGQLICLVGDNDTAFAMPTNPQNDQTTNPPNDQTTNPQNDQTTNPQNDQPQTGSPFLRREAGGGFHPNDLIFRRSDLLYDLDIDQYRQDLVALSAPITQTMLTNQDEKAIAAAIEAAADREMAQRSAEWHKHLVLGVAVMHLFDDTPLFVSNIFALCPAELDRPIHIDAGNLIATSDIYLHTHRIKVTLRQQPWQEEQVKRLVRSVDFYLSSPVKPTGIDHTASGMRALIDSLTFRHAQSIAPDRFGQYVSLPRPTAKAETFTLDDLRRHTYGAKVARVYENSLCMAQVCMPLPSPFGPVITYHYPDGAQGLCGILPDEDDSETRLEADVVVRVTINIQGQTQTTTFRQQMPYPIGGPLTYPDRRAISMEVLLCLDSGNGTPEYWRKRAGLAPSTIGNWTTGLWSGGGGGHTSGIGTFGSLLWQQVAERHYDADTGRRIRGYDLFERIDEATFMAAAEEAGRTVESTVEGNLLLTSLPSHPLDFPAGKGIRIGNGDITALSTNTRRFSGVQFGAYPLYVFTTEGIWALQRGTNDGWRSKYLVTQATTTLPGHLVSTDDAVMFFNDEGLMSISGNQLSCLWEKDMRAFEETTCQLPRFDDIITAIFPAEIAHDIQAALTLPTVGHHLSYHGQRLIWQLSEHLSMVYSLKSKQWGAAIHSEPTEQGIPVAALTRPLHLGDGHQQKRISKWMSCGLFHGSRTLDGSALRMAVWGSNDLTQWQLVATSRTHFIAGICGTPYRHYRVLIAGWLLPGESIKGLKLYPQSDWRLE